MCDLKLPCGKLDCPCSGARKPLGEDVSALRRLEARRATVSDSVYSLDRTREATIPRVFSSSSGTTLKSVLLRLHAHCMRFTS
jgi:hypothetical protein